MVPCLFGRLFSLVFSRNASPMLVTLPDEILHMILDYIWRDNILGPATLRSCSLVCKSLREKALLHQLRSVPSPQSTSLWYRSSKPQEQWPRPRYLAWRASPTLLTLPDEVLDMILDHVRRDDDNLDGQATLGSCALICRHMRQLALRHQLRSFKYPLSGKRTARAHELRDTWRRRKYDGNASVQVTPQIPSIVDFDNFLPSRNVAHYVRSLTISLRKLTAANVKRTLKCFPNATVLTLIVNKVGPPALNAASPPGECGTLSKFKVQSLTLRRGDGQSACNLRHTCRILSWFGPLRELRLVGCQHGETPYDEAYLMYLNALRESFLPPVTALVLEDTLPDQAYATIFKSSVASGDLKSFRYQESANVMMSYKVAHGLRLANSFAPSLEHLAINVRRSSYREAITEVPNLKKLRHLSLEFTLAPDLSNERRVPLILQHLALARPKLDYLELRIIFLDDSSLGEIHGSFDKPEVRKFLAGLETDILPLIEQRTDGSVVAKSIRVGVYLKCKRGDNLHSAFPAGHFLPHFFPKLADKGVLQCDVDPPEWALGSADGLACSTCVRMC